MNRPPSLIELIEVQQYENAVKLPFDECKKLLPSMTYGNYKMYRLYFGIDRIMN